MLLSFQTMSTISEKYKYKKNCTKMLYLNRGDGICQKECSDDSQCKAYGEKCINEQCQPGCTHSSQCKTYGEKCIDGQCQSGCTANSQCKQGNLLRGFDNKTFGR